MGEDECKMKLLANEASRDVVEGVGDGSGEVMSIEK